MTTIAQALQADTHQSGTSLTSAFSGGLVVTTDGAAVTSGAATAVLLGNNETLTETANATVAALGANDTVTTAALRIGFIVMGTNETLVERSAGAVITVDLGQALSDGASGSIVGSDDTILLQRLATVLNFSGGGCGGWGYSGNRHYDTSDLTIVGDRNLVQTGSVSADIEVIGHLNVIQTGCGSTDVTLQGFAAAANLVIGGSGCTTVESTAVATAIIGGSGSMTVDINASAATIFGGSGRLDATIHGSGGSYQTGSGSASIDFTGFGGVFATGGGQSCITYNGAGGLLYEAVSGGSATFDVTGNGLAVFGGDRVDATGNGNEVFTRAEISNRYSSAALEGLFTSAIGQFLPDATVAAALRATGDALLPAGIPGSSAGSSNGSSGGGSSCGSSGGGSGCGSPCGSGSAAPRIITFQGDNGAVHTGDRVTYVTLNGNNDSVFAGRVAQYVSITGGSGNGIYAGQGGGNNYYDGGPGRNYLDYQGSAAPVVVNLANGLALNGYGGVDTIRHLNWVDAGAGSVLIAGNADATLTVHGDGGILSGGRGNDTLHGTGASTRFVTGAGADTVAADGANDTYLVYANQAGSTFIDQAALGVTGTLTFATVARPSQLWLHQDAANDLVVTVLGTGNATTFAHWFATDGTGTQLARIGGTAGWLDNAGVNAVQQAMAAYETTHAGFNPATAAALPSDAALAAVLAQFTRAA